MGRGEVAVETWAGGGGGCACVCTACTACRVCSVRDPPSESCQSEEKPVSIILVLYKRGWFLILFSGGGGALVRVHVQARVRGACARRVCREVSRGGLQLAT